MKLTFIEEPELEFGTGKHIDIRFGIIAHGPFDVNEGQRPERIEIGIVGTHQSIGGVTDWFERLSEEVTAKETKKANLFPKFPGFSASSPFRSSLTLNPSLTVNVPHKELFSLSAERDYNKRMSLAADLFAEKIGLMAEKNVRVVVCAMPSELIDVLADGSEDEDEEDDDDPHHSVAPASQLAFHDLLKAKCMKFGKPIQVIRPSTYDAAQKSREKDTHGMRRRLQDEATRAWNLMTALYYKAGGIPWRKPRTEPEYKTCFIGISFYHSLDRKSVQTSLAQVFDERGYGFMVRGAEVKLHKDDRQPHLSDKAIHQLVQESLKRYRNDHGHYPARVVIHKTSKFNSEEMGGARAAMDEADVELRDLMSVTNGMIRLFRHGYYPPLRGTVLEADSAQDFIYSRGSVFFYEEYPGMYVPRSLHVRYDSIMSSKSDLRREMLLLTKMNWNNTQLDSSMPITIRAARQVGTILRYVDAGEASVVQHPYRFYM